MSKGTPLHIYTVKTCTRMFIAALFVKRKKSRMNIKTVYWTWHGNEKNKLELYVPTLINLTCIMWNKLKEDVFVSSGYSNKLSQI